MAWDQWMDLPEEKLQEIYRHILLSEATGANVVTKELSVGINVLSDFWARHYLEEYIPHGGSKIKFVTGRSGSGKTHLLDLLTLRARQMNYVTVNLSARQFMLHDFREIYLEILRHVDLNQLLAGCAQGILRELMPDADERPEGMSFLDFLLSRKQLDALTRNDIRVLLRTHFLDNPRLDNNFGLCFSLLIADALGTATLDEEAKTLLLQWLSGEKSQKVSVLRSAGMAPYRITKNNARHMLRSLSEVIRFGGYAGTLVTVDHLETILNLSGLDEMKYTPARRMNTYEIIRELIDDIDSMRHIMFIFSFDRALLDNEKIGLPAYSALWMRIQNEIVSPRFNCFTDMANLDRLAAEEYTADQLVEMTRKQAAMIPDLQVLFPDVSAEALWRRNGLGGMIPKNVPDIWPRVISHEEAEQMIADQSYGGVGLPRRALRAGLGLENIRTKEEGKDESHA